MGVKREARVVKGRAAEVNNMILLVCEKAALVNQG
jgi:hypothetical protein